MACNALAAYTRSSFGKDAPSLRSFVSGFPYVEKLVDLLEPAIEEAASKPIGEYGAEGLRQAIRALVSEVSHISQISAQNPKQNDRRQRLIAAVAPTQADKDPAVQIFSLKSELFDMRQKNAYLESIQKASYDETASLQQEIEGLYATRNKLTKQLAQAKSAFDDALSQKTLECARLEDRATAAEAALESANAEKQRMLRHLELAKEDEQMLREEVNRLRERLEKRREVQLETERKLITAKEEASRSVVVVAETPKPKQEGRDRKTIEVLRREIDAQAEEISERDREMKEDRDEIARQTRLIAQLQEKLAIANEDVERERQNAQEEIRRVEEEKYETKREAGQMETELKSLEEKMDRLARMAGVRMRDLEDWVDQKAKVGLTPQQQREWEKMNSALDGLVYFVQSLLSPKSHPFLDRRFVPIGSDLELRNNVLATIDDIRELQKVLPKSSEFQRFADLFASEKAAKEIVDGMRSADNGSDLAVIAAICSANACLVENFHELVEGLEAVYQMIPKEQRQKDKHKTVEGFVQNSLQVFESVKAFLKTSRNFRGKYQANWDGISRFLDDMYQMVKNCDGELRPVLGSVAIASIPKAAKEKIEALTLELQSLESEMQESFNESLTTIQSERDDLKEQVEKSKPEIEEMSNRIAQLKTVICSKDEEIRFLRDRVEDMEITRVEMEKTFANFHESNNQIEEKARVIQNERDRLALIVSERNTRYAKRIEEAVERERKRAESEIELTTKRANERLQILNDKLDAKRKKLRNVSRKAKEVAETLDSLLQEKIGTIRSLTAKVDQKKAKIANLKEMLARRTVESPPRESRSLSRSRTSSALSPSRPDSDRFLTQLGSLLSRYDGSDLVWTNARALASVSTIVNRLLTLERRTQDDAQRRSPSPRVTKIIRDNSNWRQWALGLIENGRDMTDEEMREVLEEGLLSGRSPFRPVLLSSGVRTPHRTLSKTPPAARSKSQQRSRK